MLHYNEELTFKEALRFCYDETTRITHGNHQSKFDVSEIAEVVAIRHSSFQSAQYIVARQSYGVASDVGYFSFFFQYWK